MISKNGIENISQIHEDIAPGWKLPYIFVTPLICVLWLRFCDGVGDFRTGQQRSI